MDLMEFLVLVPVFGRLLLRQSRYEENIVEFRFLIQLVQPTGVFREFDSVGSDTIYIVCATSLGTGSNTAQYSPADSNYYSFSWASGHSIPTSDTLYLTTTPSSQFTPTCSGISNFVGVGASAYQSTPAKRVAAGPYSSALSITVVGSPSFGYAACDLNNGDPAYTNTDINTVGTLHFRVCEQIQFTAVLTTNIQIVPAAIYSTTPVVICAVGNANCAISGITLAGPSTGTVSLSLNGFVGCTSTAVSYTTDYTVSKAITVGSNVPFLCTGVLTASQTDGNREYDGIIGPSVSVTFMAPAVVVDTTLDFPVCSH